MTSIAVNGIADQRMADMVKVTADLVHAPGMRFNGDQRIAAGGVRAEPYGKFGDGQTPISRKCRFGNLSLLGVTGIGGQWMVDLACRVNIAPYHRQIRFFNSLPFKHFGQGARHFLRERKKEHTGCGSVQAMDRIKPATGLNAHHLKQGLRTWVVIAISMNFNAGWFVNGNDVVVLIEDLQRCIHDSACDYNKNVRSGYPLRSSEIRVWGDVGHRYLTLIPPKRLDNTESSIAMK
ncbi:MAG: hypothetical protein VR64_08665 [Desulfatitalea sp. BRH_c12]|nr:MAG: hypothetical protein VR64_08665 [Desulfatitalea sp. BRH_c12]